MEVPFVAMVADLRSAEEAGRGCRGFERVTCCGWDVRL
ncbi:Uncharacterised protein [Dermatophilus congolensis]|uniref:Uncharacterized protein n=1 Tax=Dermatophilus congolensis TaxID=1863 RepID=A0AA46BN61_9MICO|nr:Uncharacterised protein [Dermatophilus congolensis]